MGSRAKVVGKGTTGMSLQGELLVEGVSIRMKTGFPVPAPYLGELPTCRRSIQPLDNN
jgi:hypothetical protein